VGEQTNPARLPDVEHDAQYSEAKKVAGKGFIKSGPGRNAEKSKHYRSTGHAADA
jgi:hypothetical protein